MEENSQPAMALSWSAGISESVLCLRYAARGVTFYLLIVLDKLRNGGGAIFCEEFLSTDLLALWPRD